MYPAIVDGDLGMVIPKPIYHVRVGQIVVRRTPHGHEAHRVIAFIISRNGDVTLLTKGDNNRTEDLTPVTELNYVGILYLDNHVHH